MNVQNSRPREHLPCVVGGALGPSLWIKKPRRAESFDVAVLLGEGWYGLETTQDGHL